MVIRQIKEKHWKHVYSQITAYGKSAPLLLQYDIDLNCNGTNYILKVQPEQNRKIIALQAVSVSPNGKGGKNYNLINDNSVLSVFLELIIYQSTERR